MAACKKRAKKVWSCWPHVKRAAFRHRHLLKDKSDDFLKILLNLWDQIHLCRTHKQACLLAKLSIEFLEEVNEKPYAEWAKAAYLSPAQLDW